MFHFKHSKEVQLAIPDDHTKALKDVIKVKRSGLLEDIAVEVDIKHPYSGDLKIALWSPKGKEIVLVNRKGGKTPFTKMKFSGAIFQAIHNSQIKGNWTLQVNDFAPRDSGTLKNWSISLSAAKKEASIGEVAVDIPDNNAKGLVSACQFDEEGKIGSLKVSLDVRHGYVGDLTATVIAPSGKSVVLHQRQGGNQKNLKTTYHGDSTAPFIGETLKGIWKLKVVDHQVRDQGTLKAWGLHVSLAGEKDDLTKIEGIGPKIAGLFNNAGLHTFLDVSKASVKKMKDILTAAGPRFQTHKPDTWAQQAALASLGDWKTLKKWQDELDGGK